MTRDADHSSSGVAGVGRAAVLTGILALGVGAGGSIMLTPAPTPPALSSPTEPSTLAVPSGSFSDPQTLRVLPGSTSEWLAYSPTSGVLRDYRCEVGVPIESGSPLMVVDDRVVLALHLATPPWRDLAAGARGDDVVALEDELLRLGLSATQDGIYGRRESIALAALWRTAGASVEQGSLPVDRVVWLPSPEVVPSSCPAQVGERLDQGAEVMSSGGGLSELKVIMPAQLRDGARVATLEDASIALPEDFVIRDPEFLVAYGATHAYRAWREGDTSTVLTIHSELIEPVRVVTVPPAALYGVSGRHGCLLAPDEPLSVEIVASVLGEVMVTAERLPQEISTHPGAQAPPCA